MVTRQHRQGDALLRLKPLGQRKTDAKLTVADCDRQAKELIRQAVEAGAEWVEVRAVYPQGSRAAKSPKSLLRIWLVSGVSHRVKGPAPPRSDVCLN